jgi:hypothetical protein
LRYLYKKRFYIITLWGKPAIIKQSEAKKYIREIDETKTFYPVASPFLAMIFFFD